MKTIETTIDKAAAYIKLGDTLKSLSIEKCVIWQVAELAEKCGCDARLLGKVRKHFKRALAQALTPGQDQEFEVFEDKCYGKNAISVRLINHGT